MSGSGLPSPAISELAADDISVHPQMTEQGLQKIPESKDLTVSENEDLLWPRSSSSPPEPKPNLDDPQQWAAYVKRQQDFELSLKALYDKTIKLERRPLPPNTTMVRPFLSSTFRDFNEERNNMFQINFPRLERECLERGVFFCPLDLRWGVTGEQSGGGEVINICLEEIDRSRPYFVVQLGFRNGWALPPDADPAEAWVILLKETFRKAFKKFPWVRQCTDKSVTELEILHGALNNPLASERIYFYFREARMLDSIPVGKKSVYAEMGHAERMLMNLKERIIKMGFRVRWFGEPAEAAELVEKDLRDSIQRDFPKGRPTPLKTVLEANRAFDELRTRIYVARPAAYASLHQYVLARESKLPFLVMGPQGSGVSSLMSNWLFDFRHKMKQSVFPGCPYPSEDSDPSSISQLLKKYSKETNWNAASVISRHIGASPESMSLNTLLFYILSELKKTFNLSDALPTDLNSLIKIFSEWLSECSQNRPLLILIDGLDQLDGQYDAHDLDWLPKTLPANVRLICSSTPGHLTCSTLQARGGRVMPVAALSDAECMLLIHDFLKFYGKEIDAKQQDTILRCARTRSPLYLTTFLHEVRVFGDYESLNSRIGFYLDAEDVPGMFRKVISRLEQDYVGVPGLVRTVFCHLLVSRRGLTERELRDSISLALGFCPTSSESPPVTTVGSPNSEKKALASASPESRAFPALQFSAIMLRISTNLVNSSVKKFGHIYLEDAVRMEYFADFPEEMHVRALANAFTVHTADAGRKAEELPFQLSRLLTFSAARGVADPKLVKDFEACLCDLELIRFALVKKAGRFDWHRFWTQLETHVDSARVTDYVVGCYESRLALWTSQISAESSEPQALVAINARIADMYFSVASFLMDTDRSYSGAVRLLDQALAFQSMASGPIHLECEKILTKKANLFLKLNQQNEALPVLERGLFIIQRLQEAVHRQIVHAGGLQACITKADADGRESQESLLKNYAALDPATAQPELVLTRDLSQSDEARNLASERITLLKRAAVIQTSIASIFKLLDRSGPSEQLYKESLQSLIEIAGPEQVQVAIAMNNLAELYMRLNRSAEALPLYQNALRILESFKGRSHPDVATVLSSMASCHFQEGKLDLAIQEYEQALRVKESFYGPDHVSSATAMLNLSYCHRNMQDFKSALKLALRALAIRERSGFADPEQECLHVTHLGNLHASLESTHEALTYFQRAVRVLANAPDPRRFARAMITSLRNMAQLQLRLEDFQGACASHFEIKKFLDSDKTLQESEDQLKNLEELCDVLTILEQFEQALEISQALHNLTKKLYGENKERMAIANFNLGCCLHNVRDEKAEMLIQQAHVAFLTIYGPAHEKTLEAEEWLRDD
jgi:tetratricopeptide (TPR) repeat protein